MKEKGIKTIGFVIMPNHLHLMLYLPSESNTINKIIANGKRFMTYEIVKRLKGNDNQSILRKLNSGVSIREREKGKIHNVFQPSFDAKMLVTEKFIIQKLNYIHTNPLRGKWKLTDDYRYYEHSSAGFYELENYGGYKITHYAEAKV